MKCLLGILAGCLALLGALQVEADVLDRIPVKRAIEHYDFPELGMRVTADLSPKWAVMLEHNLIGKYHTVVVSSPTNYFPVAEMHFVHVSDYRMSDLGADRKAGVINLFKQLGQHYQIPPDRITADKLTVEYFGSLSGFSLVEKGAAAGAADIKLFLRQGRQHETSVNPTESIDTHTNGRGMIFIAVVTQPGTLPVLKQVIRRSWTNTGYLSQEDQ
jgi:hypothetical protein